MAFDRLGSVSTVTRPKTADKWFKNANNDSKHKIVDKELQRIKKLGVVSVRKRYEDTSTPSPISPRDSYIGNGSEMFQKMASSDLTELREDVAAQELHEPESEPLALRPSPAEDGVHKIEDLDKEVAEDKASPITPYQPSMPSLTYAEGQNHLRKDIPHIASADEATAATDFGYISEDSILDDNTDDQPAQSAVLATQDLQQLVEQSSQLDEVATEHVPAEKDFSSRENTVVEQPTDSLGLVKQTSTENLSSAKAEDDRVRRLQNSLRRRERILGCPSSSFQSSFSSPTAAHNEALEDIVPKIYMLLENSRPADAEQDNDNLILHIHDELLRLVNTLKLKDMRKPASLAGDDDREGDHDSELERLRRQVKDLQHRCELQMVDLRERTACHTKLMYEKDSLQRKFSEMTSGDIENSSKETSLTDHVQSHNTIKNLNRLSTGSDISSMSFMANQRSASRASSRRLNPRPETPLPPQLPPPKDPLPPIPADGQPNLSTSKRHSGVQVTIEDQQKIVQELLDKLQQDQEQKIKSKAIIDSLESKLRQSQARIAQLEQSVRQLESERTQLQIKQRAPGPPPPSQPSQQHYSAEKKKNRGSIFSVLMIFGKRDRN